VLDACWEFHAMYRRLESLNPNDEEFSNHMDDIKDELKKLMENFYKVMKTIMMALYTYNQTKFNAPGKINEFLEIKKCMH
jgi:DNA-binding ferritin-like protein (Dps family)